MTIKETNERLEEGESLKTIAQAYSEIANLKVKRIRAYVERNRIFFHEISKVYAIVKKFAAKKGIRINKPKQTISIVLTSNRGFYGSINSDLLKFFVDTTYKTNTDRIILNKVGVDYFRAQPIFRGITEIILKDDQPDAAELLSLVNLIKDYNQVLVFYSGMKSLLKQVPAVTDITATNLPEDSGQTGHKSETNFIFEPELPKILEFFDNQILTLLLEETFLESELSRTASRFISMDNAETEANKTIKEYQTLKAYTKRSLDNNTILENFATMIAVRKENYG